MLSAIANRFRARGLTVRVAIADTWGAAHACDRANQPRTVIVPPGEGARAFERLPISLLRIPPNVISDLGRFRTVRELAARRHPAQAWRCLRGWAAGFRRHSRR